MDYYNFNSGFTDSLDFLNPAAQKNSRSRHRVFAPEYSCGEDVLYTRKQACFDQSCQKPSSNSLILKRTRGREVTEHTENIRYRPCPPPKLLKSNQNLKNRPLIRVTVIPNNNTYTQTKRRKHKPSVKKIQSTVSNHESFFKAKNIFLVVGGNKREKIYEIKTTGSEYSNGTRYAKNEEIPLEQNFQQLLYSLNMDKKKKKDKGKGKKEKDKKKEEDGRVDEQESDASLKYNIEYESPPGSMLRDCMCSPAIDTVTPRKSRVTITGRIGRTEDDRYVLRCNATIDGTPVESNFYQDQNVSSPEWKAPESKPQDMKEIPRMSNLCKCIPSPRERVFYCQRETLTEPEAFKVSQKDESVQTAFQFDDSYRQTLCPAYIKPCPAYATPSPAYTTPCPAYTTPCPAFRSVETQYSPRNVNAVCFSNVEKLNIYSSKDEVVQCNCPPDLLTLSKDIAFEADYEVNSPKSCNSPLVIISVYPKQDSDDKYTDETSSNKDSSVSPPPKEKEASKKKAGKKKQDKKNRAASPLPPKSPVKGKEEKKDKIKEKGKDKADKNKQPKGNKKGLKKEKPEREEKEKTEKESRSYEQQQSTKVFGTSFKCAECCMGCIGNRNRQAIQETTQNNKKRVMNWVSAKNDISNVAINIDGENEFYDVLLRQGDIATDLQVRKTIKDAKFAQDPVDSGSLENFLLVNGDQTRNRNKSFSQTDFLDQRFVNNSDMLDTSVPRLNVRDSIEICHRREEKNSFVAVTNSASSSTSTNQIKLTQFKHFKGDNCKLPNPVARDKEIRELLGIDKTKSKPSRIYQEFAAKAEMDYNCSLHCFYRRQRKANVSNVHNIHELKKQLYMDDEVTQARHNDDYLVDEFGDSSDCNNGVHDNIDLCNDSDIIAQKLEHSYITFESKLGRLTTKTKNAHEEGFSRSNTKKSKQHHHKPSQICVSDSIPTVEHQIPQATSIFTKYRNICVRPEAGGDPCSVIIKCPYRQPNEESSSTEGLEEQQVEPETSTGEEEQPITKEEKEEVQEITSNETSNENKNAPLYQQLVLNRNINIYLQIEQFTKQKPIILSHKQYNKVKKTIESATGKKSSGKVMCICKPQSEDIKKKLAKKSLDKKSISPKTSKKVCDKVICECKPQDKETKKSIFSKTHKDKEDHTHTQHPDHTINKCNKHKLANFYDSPTNENNLNSDNCCDVNLVGLDNSRIIRTEILYMPSRTFLLDDQETPMLTNQPKLFTDDFTINNTTSKRFNDTIKEKSRITPAEKKTFEGPENKNNRCRKFITSKYHDEVYGEENMHRKIKPTNLDEECVRKFEETRFRKTKHSKINKEDNYNENEKKRSKKRVERFQDIGNHDEAQNNTVKKNKNDPKKKSSHYAEGQSLEKKESVIEHWKGDRNESVNNIPRPVFCQEEQTVDVSQDQFCKRCRRLKPLNYSGNHGRQNNRRLKTCYCCEVNEKGSESPMDDTFLTNSVKDRQYAASSTEVRYTSVIYENYKHVTFSSMNVADNNISIQDYVANQIPQDYNSNSLHTLFKRRRRTPTPNLGTSAYSLCSTVATTAAKVGSPRQPVYEKKPFLRRLMSCLVMRSKTSGVKIDVRPAPKWNSANSSVDSYHINTSLGAVELSSSIYDTSASFYSNHSIQPISSKIIKRGFLSSVRGFLTNRKV